MKKIRVSASASIPLLVALAACNGPVSGSPAEAVDAGGPSPAGDASDAGSTDASDSRDSTGADAKPDAAVGEAGVAPSNVYSGGTDSINGVNGMHDLAVAANSTAFREQGGGLYIHAIGWANTTEADRRSIVGLFPELPIFETGQPQLAPSLKSFVVPYWPQGAYVTCVNVSVNNGVGVATVADMQTMRAESFGLTRLVGQYYSPNDGTSYHTPFSDPKWDDLRTGATIGGALCIDAPPQYYLAQSPLYQQWTADEVAWATSHNIVVVFALFPRASVDFLSDTMTLVADQKARGAAPTIWAVNGYYGNYGSKNPPIHPIGSETVPNDSMYTALKLLLNHL